MPSPAGSLPRVVVFGEALTDLIRQEDGAHWLARPGGAPWNVARVVARLGVATAFAGGVSDDVFGDELVRQSAAAGLDPRFLQRLEHSPLLAVVPSTTPPRYFFVGDDSADLHFDPGCCPPAGAGRPRSCTSGRSAWRASRSPRGWSPRPSGAGRPAGT